uniref:Uncharacterized protein n=1 Tax=Myoviridae sp. ctIty1 TaxID=2827673 RepID=A0A8S5TGC2_9CAUD|nr:MAG TPA: hypothetical protein [Myoviridae sp. ctIty1]
MKLQIKFTNKEAEVLSMVARKYDFMGKFNHEKLSKKYHEGNEAGSFTYSGMKSEGTTIDFETHEKLLLAAGRVYLKYADTVNGILCGIKSVVMSCKSLFKNFESDYKKELNNAFDEIKTEEKMKAEAKKAEEKIRKEIREKAEEDLFKRKFDRIRKIEKETEADDDELY